MKNILFLVSFLLCSMGTLKVNASVLIDREELLNRFAHIRAQEINDIWKSFKQEQRLRSSLREDFRLYHRPSVLPDLPPHLDPKKDHFKTRPLPFNTQQQLHQHSIQPMDSTVQPPPKNDTLQLPPPPLPSHGGHP